MRVLLIAHGFPPTTAGGTEVYTHDLARTLRERFDDEVFVLTREADTRRPDFAVRREERAGIPVMLVNNTFRHVRAFEDTYRCETIRRIGARWLDEIQPDVVHVQHLTGLSVDLLADCRWRRIPTIVTLNDFWLMCHRGQLLDVDYRRCAGPAPDTCGGCLADEDCAGAAAVRGAATREIGKRVAHVRWAASGVSRFLAPSRTVHRRFVEFGFPEARVVFQQQGIDVRAFRDVRRTVSDRLRIGFLGSLIASKAPHLALEAFARLPPAAAEMHLVGSYAPYHGDDRYRRVLEPLLMQPGVHHHGPRPHHEIAQVLASLDVLVVPSVWLENSPFVIREAFAAGVPVVASNLGGMAEMVAHEESGLLFEVGQAQALAHALRRLLEDRGLLETLRRGIPPVRTIEDDAAWTREQYYECRDVATVVGGDHPPALTRLAAVVLHDRGAEDTALTVRSLRASRRPLDDVLVVRGEPADALAAVMPMASPDATVEAPGSVGRAARRNVGILAALERGADLVLLVEGGTIVPPSVVGRLEEALADRRNVGIAGPVLISRSDPGRVVSAGIMLSGVTGRVRREGHGRPMAALDFPAERRVDALSGCLLINRSVFERVGLPAATLELLEGEIDFCLRARAEGFASVCVGRAMAHRGDDYSGDVPPRRRLYAGARGHRSLSGRRSPIRVVHDCVRSPVSLLESLRILGRDALVHLRRRKGKSGG